MTSKRRHPAQASRILAAGLSTATVLGVVAVLGAAPSASPQDGSGIVAPPKVAVVIRIPGTGATGRQVQPPLARQAPDTTTRAS
jgi:hypothetical protein